MPAFLFPLLSSRHAGLDYWMKTVLLSYGFFEVGRCQ